MLVTSNMDYATSTHPSAHILGPPSALRRYWPGLCVLDKPVDSDQLALSLTTLNVEGTGVI